MGVGRKTRTLKNGILGQLAAKAVIRRAAPYSVFGFASGKSLK